MGLEDLLKDIDFDSTTDSGPADQTEDLKGPVEGKTQMTRHKQTDVDQKARELDEIQKRAEREKEAARDKAAARAREYIRRMTSSAKPSPSGPEENLAEDQTRQQTSQETSTADENSI